MHARLQSFLDDVWNNAHNILFAGPFQLNAPRAELYGDTVEHRVYSLYASGLGPSEVHATISEKTYELRLRRIKSPYKSGWVEGDNQPLAEDKAFYMWTNCMASGLKADFRIYLSPRLSVATDLFQRVLDCSAKPAPEMDDLSLFGDGDSQRKRSSDAVPPERMVDGYDLGEVVAAAKIARGNEAFKGRRDVIVVYVNKDGGRKAAGAFARRIANWPFPFNDKTPPMTQTIARGISIGAEVHGDREANAGQWRFGSSFGSVRCTLIAHALIEALRGRSLTGNDLARQHKVPLTPPEPRHGLKLIDSLKPVDAQTKTAFRQLVVQKFGANNIDVNVPWD